MSTPYRRPFAVSVALLCAACIPPARTGAQPLSPSRSPVACHAREIAAALRDSLGCRDALFLDGSISALYTSDCLPAAQNDGAIIYVAAADTGAVRPTCAVPHGRTTAEPYSTFTLRIGGTQVRALDQLRDFYPGNRGAALQIEMPFEFGLIGLTVDQVMLRSAVDRTGDVAMREVAVDWRAAVPVLPRVQLRPGMRIGDLHLHFQDPNAGPGMETMEQFMVGATAGLDVALTRRLSLTGEGTWLFVPSASRVHLGYLSAFLSVASATPRWLSRILR